MHKLMLAVSLLTALAATYVLAGSAAPIAGSFTTSLSGREEVPRGDADGRGTATIRLNVAKRQVCWTLRPSRIGTPNAAHIHKGAKGKAGAIVVPLGAAYLGPAYRATGCTLAPAPLVKNILDNPTRYYVNIHNVQYPNGAVRGQL